MLWPIIIGRIVVPPTKTRTTNSLGFGTAVGATDIAEQRVVLLAGKLEKERVIVPWDGASGLRDGVFGSDAPAIVGLTSFVLYPKAINRRAQSRT
jgi:hypothetical protein